MYGLRTACFLGCFLVSPLLASEPLRVDTELQAEAVDAKRQEAPADIADGAVENLAFDYWRTRDDFFQASLSDGDEDNVFRPVMQVQAQPLDPVPRPFEPEFPLPSVAEQFTSSVFGVGGVAPSLLTEQRRRRASSLTADVVFGAEGEFRATTDAGNLLGRSYSTTGVNGKQRSPVITDTRIRGSGVGQLLASGSYWFPARPDLDTMLSKIDSRIIGDMIVIKGPYATRYGPGHTFVDVEILKSPRYCCPDTTYSTVLEYKTNGQQFYGRQVALGGASNYGYRFSYGNRTGNDYEDGAGTDFISSYTSKDFDFAFGYDITPYRHLEFNYVRLDQYDVEVPTQLLDLEFLKTDGFDVSYVMEDSPYFDRFTVEGWYNQTNSRSNANSPAKRALKLVLDDATLNIDGEAENMSTGFSTYGDWEADGAITTVGVDMRYLRQEVNQLSNVLGLSFPGLFGNNATPEVNGPLPKAYTANPGIFIEQLREVNASLNVNAGARFDIVEMNAAHTVEEVGGLAGPTGIIYNPSGMDLMGFGGSTIPGVQADLETVLLGSFNQSYAMASGFITGEYKINPCWTASGGFGFGMRNPTMAELYPLPMISTVMPQQPFSILFGNPNLRPEKRSQFDLGLRTDQGCFRGGVNGYVAWVEDYVTYDALRPDWFVFQYVNTDLAILAGFDAFAEYDAHKNITAFAMASYV